MRKPDSVVTIRVLSSDRDTISARALLDKARDHLANSLDGQLSLQATMNDARKPDRRESVQRTDAEALFTLWVTCLVREANERSINFDDIVSRFALEPEQARAWLQRAVDEGLIIFGSEVNTYAVPNAPGLEHKKGVMPPATAHTTELPEQSVASVETATP